MDFTKFDCPEVVRQAPESFKTRYLGHWYYKEENNMDIPGKLRADIKRIFGSHDPMDHIEDARIEMSPDGATVELTLRVPSYCEKYIGGDPIPRVPVPSRYSIQEAAAEAARVAELLSRPIGAPRVAPMGEWRTGKPLPVELPKPERVLFSGPFTHVFWPDGSKTTVRLAEGQEFDEYTAFCAAMTKKMFGGSTPKAKKFLDAIKVIQKPKAKKVKPGEPVEAECTVVDGQETELVPMPGTTEPDWGEKHWGEDIAAATVKEGE